MQRQNREDRLEGSRAAEKVPGGALGGRNGDVVKAVTERHLESGILGNIADRGARGVCIDVGNLVRGGACVLECELDST